MGWPSGYHGRQREKGEQAAIVQLLRSIGAKVYLSGTTRPRGDHPGTCQTPGIPDLEAFLPPPARCTVPTRARYLLKVEVKAAGGRLRPEQEEYKALCDDAGVEHVLGGVDDVIKWLIRHQYLRADNVPHYRVPPGQPDA